MDAKWYCCPFRIVCSRARTLKLRPFGSESEGKVVALRFASADDVADVLRRLKRAPAARRAGRAKESLEFELVDENDDVIPPATRVSEIGGRSGVRYRALRSARKGASAFFVLPFHPFITNPAHNLTRSPQHGILTSTHGITW